MCHQKKKEWIEKDWIKHLEKAYQWSNESGNYPLFAVVPDIPFDANGTIEEWKKYAPIVKEYGFELAFAVQNGHTPKDVPEEANWVFVGGDTQWKRQNISTFCNHFKKVHVARINTGRWLWVCHHAGAKSVDGTGWIWKNKPEHQQLIEYFEITEGKRHKETGALFPLGNFTSYRDIQGSFNIV